MMKGDSEGALESLNNIMIAKKDAVPDFDAFKKYRSNQKLWEKLCNIVAEKRYEMRRVIEEHNLSKNPIHRNEHGVRNLNKGEAIEILQKTFEFEIIREGWEKLADKFHVKTFYEDEMIFRCGDFNETMYVILKGEIQLFAGNHETGGEVEITRLEKGDILGESSLAHQTFKLNCRAVQFTELLGIDKRDITKLVEAHPEVGVKFFQKVLTKVVEKMRKSNVDSLKMGGGTVQAPYIDGTAQDAE
jgi:CRP-like cAMP-binding protein